MKKGHTMRLWWRSHNEVMTKITQVWWRNMREWWVGLQHLVDRTQPAGLSLWILCDLHQGKTSNVHPFQSVKQKMCETWVIWMKCYKQIFTTVYFQVEAAVHFDWAAIPSGHHTHAADIYCPLEFIPVNLHQITWKLDEITFISMASNHNEQTASIICGGQFYFACVLTCRIWQCLTLWLWANERTNAPANERLSLTRNTL